MKSIVYGIVFLLWLSSTCVAQQFITPDDARQAVRAFEGDDTLEFVRAEFAAFEYDSLPAYYQWLRRDVYMVDDTDEAENHSWQVNAVTGEIIFASYADRSPAEGSNEPTGPLTQAECLQIAEDFARGKYEGFDSMGLHLEDQEWDRWGWEFLWRQKVAYDACTPNNVSVTVGPLDGAVQSYSASRIVVPDPQQPTVTAEQALQLALSATGIVTLNNTKGPFLLTDPARTYWQLEVDGLDATGKHMNYLVELDAYSGEVTGAYPEFASQNTTPNVGGGFISIRELASKVPIARVHWLGKEAKLFIGRNRYTLVPGKDTIEWTGGTIKLSQKMKVVNGRLMVPSGLLDVLRSASAPKKAPPPPAMSK